MVRNVFSQSFGKDRCPWGKHKQGVLVKDDEDAKIASLQKEEPEGGGRMVS